ncbi:MAG: FIST N-terminal domain-containing protein [Verrucomicrobiota bacterium]
MLTSTCRWTAETGWNIPPLHPGDPGLVLYFGASSLMDGNAAPIHELVAKFPNSVVCGCSTAGEILASRVHDESVVASLVWFDSTRVRAVAEPIANNADSMAVGRRAAAELDAPDLRHVLILSEGLTVNGTALMAGFREVLAPNVAITGGLAGDGPQFKKTFVGLGNSVKSDQLVAVGFYGDGLVVSYSSRGGWEGFGPRRLITRAEGNTLFMLDGQPALDLYKRYLGARASELPATGLLFPLELTQSLTHTNGLVRTILAVDEETRSLTFAGDMPEGWYARLMKATTEQLVDGAACAGNAAANTHTDASLAILVSCVGRRLVLGQRIEEELEAVIDSLPKSAQAIGFYSYGEVCPGNLGDASELHNQTMTITVLGERT